MFVARFQTQILNINEWEWLELWVSLPAWGVEQVKKMRLLEKGCPMRLVFTYFQSIEMARRAWSTKWLSYIFLTDTLSIKPEVDRMLQGFRVLSRYISLSATSYVGPCFCIVIQSTARPCYDFASLVVPHLLFACSPASKKLRTFYKWIWTHAKHRQLPVLTSMTNWPTSWRPLHCMPQ